MIIGNVATLVVRGRAANASARHVTQVMGIEPTDWGEIGDEHISATRPRRPQDGRLREHAVWALKVEDEGASGDETGFASLRALLVLLRSKRDAVLTLELDDDYGVWISWGGFSDSPQGGFVMQADVALMLGELGVPLLGTAYLDDGWDAEERRRIVFRRAVIVGGIAAMVGTIGITRSAGWPAIALDALRRRSRRW